MEDVDLFAAERGGVRYELHIYPGTSPDYIERLQIRIAEGTDLNFRQEAKVGEELDQIWNTLRPQMSAFLEENGCTSVAWDTRNINEFNTISRMGGHIEEAYINLRTMNFGYLPDDAEKRTVNGNAAIVVDTLRNIFPASLVESAVARLEAMSRDIINTIHDDVTDNRDGVGGEITP